MLAGRTPFVATDKMAILHKHVYEPPPSLSSLRSSLSAETVAIVENCLQKDPANRYQTAAELRQAIDQAIRTEGGPDRTALESAWRPPATGGTGKRRIWPYAIVAVVLIALLAVGVQLGRNALAANRLSVQPTVQAIGASADTPDPGNPPTEAPATEVVATSTQSLPPTAEPTETLQPTPEATATVAATGTSTATPTVVLATETIEIGRSVQGRPIQATRFGNGPNHLVFIGGLHAGYAPGSVAVALRAIDHFTSNPQQIPASVTLHIIPNANPDSPIAEGELRGRLNANNVDLNRNWDCRWVQDARFRNEVVPGSGGPSPFSEPETQALRDFIIEKDADAVIFWEARASQGLSTPGACEGGSLVSGQLARTFGVAAGYVVEDFEALTNQELNGDGSNWLDQKGIPAIAILLPDYDDVDWNNNLAGMLAVLGQY
jgi:hypothetical protein